MQPSQDLSRLWRLAAEENVDTKSRMFALSIKDFAISTEHVFARAVSFDQAEFTVFSEGMLKTFGLVLLAKDISLDQGDRLFNYRLVCRMFSGAVDVTLTSAGVTTAFRNGQNKRALKLVGDSIVSIETIVQNFPTSFRRLTF